MIRERLASLGKISSKCLDIALGPQEVCGGAKERVGLTIRS